MITEIPVLEDMNGYYIVSIYESTTDGAFKRTPKRPFRQLSRLIGGVFAPVGRIECNPRTGLTISWRTPTVISNFEDVRVVFISFFVKKYQH